MRNGSQSADRMPGGRSSSGPVSSTRAGRERNISPEDLDQVFSTVGQSLRDGKSSKAEKLLEDTIANYTHTAENLAHLKRLLAFTFETIGRYKDSLDAVIAYEDPEVRDLLTKQTQVRVTTQLAVAYNNFGDHPKAVTLLKGTLEVAKENELNNLLGPIDSGLARVYRKLNECAICRDYAGKALAYFRENGDWLGMSEAYREIALSYHQEGNSEKSLEYFDLGIKIIGDRSAPFMLGKLFTDMSGAYWFLRRPNDGIACLEKSIGFFEQTEHVLNSIIAYNNLGINLMLIGEWERAEEIIKRALDLAIDTNHVHIAGILDSLGELKILRDNLVDAEDYLDQAITIARERNREWYAAQAMRNLARCYLAQGKVEKAVAKAKETIELCGQIGDKHYANMAKLVLAESYLGAGDPNQCEATLKSIEESDPTSDFYVLGNIQRIRGLAELENDQVEVAVHHFNRSLTIFEAAEDLYHTALAELLIGENVGPENVGRAKRHLGKAGEIFRKLGVTRLADRATKKLDSIKDFASGEMRAPAHSNSAASQLLMVRLAEATASRELLFRELVAVLQQESRAKKIIIAEPQDDKKIRPFITHGYSPVESNELVGKYEDALHKNGEKAFARTRNVSIFPLKTANAKPAYLLIHPATSAILNDGSPLNPLLPVVELGLDVIALRQRDKRAPVEQESSAHTSSSLMPGFIHSSPAMTSLVDEVYKIRSSDVTVLVTGESGTGKELVSRAIHTLSNRKDKVFVPFNCTAVPKELAEGHLFGYKRGAFTGAVTDSPGMIRAADGGTLFLDEIGDLPIDVQPKLLRFLQEGEVQPIGEKTPIKVDVRVIAATNMPLEQKVADGSFREDLYYRLNVIRLRVPPLRERRSEIPPIVNYYINHYSSRFAKHDITFTPQTVDLLMVCNWEGNVRQLCNEVQRIIARAVDNEVITPDHLSPELKRSVKPLTASMPTNSKPIATYDTLFTPFKNIPDGGTLENAVTELEMQMIRSALARHNWNISRVAVELGLTRRGLYLKIARYGIEKAA